MRHRAGWGRTWNLKSRPNPWLTVQAVNVCYYQRPEPEMVERILQTPEASGRVEKNVRQEACQFRLITSSLPVLCSNISPII